MNHMSLQAKSPTTVKLKHYDKITAIILALYPTDLFLTPQHYGNLTEKPEHLCLQAGLAQTGKEGVQVGRSIRYTECFSTDYKLKKLQNNSLWEWMGNGTWPLSVINSSSFPLRPGSVAQINMVSHRYSPAAKWFPVA